MTTAITIKNVDGPKTVEVEVMSSYNEKEAGKFVSVRKTPVSPESEIVEYVHSHQHLIIKEEA